MLLGIAPVLTKLIGELLRVAIAAAGAQQAR